MSRSAAAPKESWISRFFSNLRRKTKFRADNTPETNFTPIPHLFWADLPRLTRGKIQYMLIEYAWRMTVGIERERAEPAPAKTPVLRWKDLEEVFHCSSREVKDDAREADARGLIEIEESGVGSREAGVTIRVLYQAWEGLPDYKPGRPEPVKDTKPDQPERPLCSPFRVARGQKHGFLPWPAEADAYRFELEDGVDAVDVAPILRQGKLTYRLRVSETKDLTDKTRKHTSTESPESMVPNPPEIQVPKPLAHACAHFGLADDGAVLQLLADCISFSSTATVEEICEQVFRIGEGCKERRRAPAAIRAGVPAYFGSTAYRDGVRLTRKDVQSEREKIADEIWGKPVKRGRK